MHAINDELDGVVHRADYESFERYVDLNERLHATLLDAAGSPVLRRTLAGIVSLPFASASAFVLAEAELPESREILVIAQYQHRELVRAIERREGARAERIGREHARLAQPQPRDRDEEPRRARAHARGLADQAARQVPGRGRRRRRRPARPRVEMSSGLSLPLALSPLDQVLKRAGAHMAERQGWLVAADFGSLAAELAVSRAAAGLADVSSIAKFELRGSEHELAAIHPSERSLASRRGVRARDAWWCPLSPRACLLVLALPGAKARVSQEVEELAAGRDVRVVDVTSDRVAVCLLQPAAARCSRARARRRCFRARSAPSRWRAYPRWCCTRTTSAGCWSRRPRTPPSCGTALSDARGAVRPGVRGLGRAAAPAGGSRPLAGGAQPVSNEGGPSESGIDCSFLRAIARKKLHSNEQPRFGRLLLPVQLRPERPPRPEPT